MRQIGVCAGIARYDAQLVGNKKLRSVFTNPVHHSSDLLISVAAPSVYCLSLVGTKKMGRSLADSRLFPYQGLMAPRVGSQCLRGATVAVPIILEPFAPFITEYT